MIDFYFLQQGSKEDIRLIPAVIGGEEKTRHGIVLAKNYYHHYKKLKDFHLM